MSTSARLVIQVTTPCLNFVLIYESSSQIPMPSARARACVCVRACACACVCVWQPTWDLDSDSKAFSIGMQHIRRRQNLDAVLLLVATGHNDKSGRYTWNIHITTYLTDNKTAYNRHLRQDKFNTTIHEAVIYPTHTYINTGTYVKQYLTIYNKHCRQHQHLRDKIEWILCRRKITRYD